MGLNLDCDKFELSLIGTGGGYGESIVIHLGDNNWIVVDSCINPVTKNNLPLDFLDSRGVDVSKDVKLIICTHWHDDHILGISDLLTSCKSSNFCMAPSTDRKKFLQLIQLDYNKAKTEASASSTSEIAKCFDILKERKSTITRACQDKILISFKNDSIESKVYSLSPSDFVLTEFDHEISTLITEYGNPDRKIVIQSPNDKSVVLLIEVNDKKVLLGSDLEVCSNNQKGWLCILEKSQCIGSTKSSLFKVPHHGSSTAYHPRIWEQLLEPNSICFLTPFSKGAKKIPDKEMLGCILNHTNYLYITSLYGTSRSPKKRDHKITKMINQFNSTVQEVKFESGIVQCKINIHDTDAIWETALLGSAEQISRETTAKL